tara:strand:+ start:5818 stop:6219 length:402 start_codon:yes stop_codon:yes gene_type:complete
MLIGFTASVFDLLHAGHISMLEEAKNNCEYLICGLQIDPSIDRDWKNPPVQSIVERYIQLYAVKYVDEIIPYATEKDLEDILKTMNINVRFIGEEYFDKNFTGKDICIQRKIRLFYNSRKHDFSTSELRGRIK